MDWLCTQSLKFVYTHQGLQLSEKKTACTSVRRHLVDHQQQTRAPGTEETPSVGDAARQWTLEAGSSKAKTTSPLVPPRRLRGAGEDRGCRGRPSFPRPPSGCRLSSEGRSGRRGATGRIGCGAVLSAPVPFADRCNNKKKKILKARTHVLVYILDKPLCFSDGSRSQLSSYVNLIQIPSKPITLDLYTASELVSKKGSVNSKCGFHLRKIFQYYISS